ncbi:MAG: hypothetical protein AMJ56_11135 [Anaerolineae bacterium SG8_19]|jgi:hypothetical protein|nr:MAG: hypothetical protein AMJ56_11135 [Anaerolineae bacterium SG8_19]
MKKLVLVWTLFGIVALVLLLIVNSVTADPLFQEGEIEPEPGREGEIEPGREGEVEPEPGGVGEVEPEAAPNGTALRIDFEFTDDVARTGTYVVQEVGGGFVAEWYALDGWRDSGWIDELNISREAVHVQVLYYPTPEAEPTIMRILNPAGGTEYGWLARGIEHALEVEFPDEAIVSSGTGEQPVVESVPTRGTPLLVDGEQVHVVQSGNNLFRIGLQYGCSYQELAAYNDIANPGLIIVGQEIRIPASCRG